MTESDDNEDRRKNNLQGRKFDPDIIIVLVGIFIPILITIGLTFNKVTLGRNLIIFFAFFLLVFCLIYYFVSHNIINFITKNSNYFYFVTYIIQLCIFLIFIENLIPIYKCPDCVCESPVCTTPTIFTTDTVTDTSTNTPPPPSPTHTITQTSTLIPTHTNTPTYTPTHTNTPTITPTISITPSQTPGCILQINWKSQPEISNCSELMRYYKMTDFGNAFSFVKHTDADDDSEISILYFEIPQNTNKITFDFLITTLRNEVKDQSSDFFFGIIGPDVNSGKLDQTYHSNFCMFRNPMDKPNDNTLYIHTKCDGIRLVDIYENRSMNGKPFGDGINLSPNTKQIIEEQSVTCDFSDLLGAIEK